MTRRREMASPVGALLLESDDGVALTAVRFVLAGADRGAQRGVDAHEGDAHAHEEEDGPRRSRAPVLLEAERQLADYFAGRRTRFDLPIRARGTRFQQQVWDALAEIPHGSTSSYRDVAQRIGRPHATRAVGVACGRNPLPVVVPCHRVVGANGALTGYAGGVGTKRALLTLEAPTPLPALRTDSLGAGLPMAPVA